MTAVAWDSAGVDYARQRVTAAIDIIDAAILGRLTPREAAARGSRQLAAAAVDLHDVDDDLQRRAGAVEKVLRAAVSSRHAMAILVLAAVRLERLLGEL